jgi:phage-related protein
MLLFNYSIKQSKDNKMRIPEYKTFRKNMKHYKAVQEFIRQHEKFVGCFFWNPPSSASGRRRMEFETSFSFVLEGVTYTFEQSVDCSCKNIYYSSNITVDGKKKNIRAAKKLVS